MQNKLALVFSTTCIILIIVIFAKVMWPPGHVEARQELLHLRNQLQLGSTKKQVLSQYFQSQYKWLSYNVDTKYSKGNIYFSTPGNLSGSNWTLVVKFDHGKSSSLLVRTSDSKTFKPLDAPEDLTTSLKP